MSFQGEEICLGYLVTPVSPRGLSATEPRLPRETSDVGAPWHGREIWPAAPARLAHAPPRRTQVIPIPHIGRTDGRTDGQRLSQRTCGCRRIGKGRRGKKEKRGRISRYPSKWLSWSLPPSPPFPSAVIANRSGHLGRRRRRWSNLFPVAVEGKNNPRATPYVYVLLITLRFGDTKL